MRLEPSLENIRRRLRQIPSSAPITRPDGVAEDAEIRLRRVVQRRLGVVRIALVRHRRVVVAHLTGHSGPVGLGVSV